MADAAAETESGLRPGFELAGRYRIGCELGRGGMGVVYEAKHLALGCEVALKTLHPWMLADRDAVARFTREARSAASIGHPGIVQVFDLATDQGITFLAMERLRGEDLRQRLERSGALSIARVITLGRELAQAIAAAHQRGVLHRDLTPRNVFLATDDLGNECVKVLDFGIAKLTESLSGDGVSESLPPFGTLMYMAPERIAGTPADARVDVYAIGALLYEALTAAPPFAVRPYAELALKIALESPARLRALRPEAPAPLIAIIERAMHKDPRKRWDSAQELANALLALSPVPTEISARRPELSAATFGKGRRRTFLIVAASALLLGGLAASTTRSRPGPRGEIAGDGAIAARAKTADPPRPSVTARAIPPAAAEPSRLPLPQDGVAAPRSQRVRVTSHPAGASVAVNGGLACRAPCWLEMPAQGGAVLRARLTGHQSVERRLRGAPPEAIELQLRPSEASGIAEQASPVVFAPLPPLLPRR